MKEKKDLKDKIIKIVLIIIIILLLLHNCALLKKKGKERTPSGNVNIIEIICDKDFDCVEPVNGGSDDGSIGTGTSGTSSGSSSTTSGSGTSGGGQTSGSVLEPENELFVRDNRLVWSGNTQLNLFEDSIYSFEDKIAPESSNTYQYIVKNSTNYNLKYKITFEEINPYHMNLMYKLKKNNDYIVDHYVYYNELNIDNQMINANTNDTYYLEWKWVSADNDTEVGINEGNYQIKISVEAESTNG